MSLDSLFDNLVQIVKLSHMALHGFIFVRVDKFKGFDNTLPNKLRKWYQVLGNDSIS